MGELLRELHDEVAPAMLTVVGNSAGAGLGLAAAQWPRDHGHRQLDGLVLVSPGLDARVDRPEQVAIAARDPVQDIPGILEAARLYAGELDIAHPYVSPLNGDLSGLAPMLVISGTLDLITPTASRSPPRRRPRACRSSSISDEASRILTPACRHQKAARPAPSSCTRSHPGRSPDLSDIDGRDWGGGLQKRDHDIVHRRRDAVAPAEADDGAVSRIDLQRPAGEPVGMQRIDGVRRPVAIALDYLLDEAIIEGGRPRRAQPRCIHG